MQPFAMNLSRFKPLASSVLITLSLSACAQLGLDQQKWPWQDNAASQTSAHGGMAEGQAAGKVQPAGRSAAKPSPELKALRPSPRPAADKEVAAAVMPPVPPPKLVGLSEDETAELLGRPAEESVEPPGKVWTYKASGCKLSVHLFPDMEKGGFYALDYTADSARDACLGKVAGEARKKGGAILEESARHG